MSTMMMTIMLQDMPVISVLFDNEYDGDDNYAAGYARPQCHLPPRKHTIIRAGQWLEVADK